LTSNFCRNPSDERSVWCYTTDPEIRWGYCDEIDIDNQEGLWGEEMVAELYRGK
jgi:hypothetical protein